MYKIRFFFLYVLLLFSISIHAEYFQRIGLSEGLTQPSVMSISQDKLGRMWFGTREGINIYDGVKVTSHKGWVHSADSMIWLGNLVREISPGPNGDMYFISDFNLMKYELKSEKFFQLTFDSSTGGLSEYENQVWFVHKDSICYIDSSTSQIQLFYKTHSILHANDIKVNEKTVFVAHEDGLLIIDRKTKAEKKHMTGISVSYLFESSMKELWIGTYMHGMYWLDVSGNLHRVPTTADSSKGFNSKQVRQFVEDNDKNVWFGTIDGLYKYDIKTREYKLIQIPERVGGLTHSSVYSLYKDHQGVLWVGTYFGGVNYFEPNNTNFVFYEYRSASSENSYFSYLGSMVLDKNNHLWLCTDGGGLTCMNEDWQVVHRFRAGEKNSLLHNNVKDIAYDESTDCMYIGTYLGGLSRYDMRTGKFFNYLTEYHKGNIRPGNIVNFLKVCNGKVYILTSQGFFILDTKTQLFTKIDIPLEYRLGLDVDTYGHIYVIGWDSFLCIDEKNPQNYRTISLKEHGCTSTLTKVIIKDEGVILGSLGSGIFYYNTVNKKITHYTKDNKNIPSDYCYNICLTEDKNIIFTTDKGITYYNPRIDKFSTVEFYSYFPNTHIVNEGGLLAGNEGTVFVGSTEGLVTFHEREFHKVREKAVAPKFYFSHLYVGNKQIVPGDETEILSESLPFTESIHLDYTQRNIRIEYGISDFEQNLTGRSFMYMLEGMNDKWIRTTERTAHYVNLQPGNYTLHVALMNYEDKVDEILLNIYVANPWYKTGWAYLIYIVLIILVIHAIVKNRISKRTLSLKLENERKEKEHIEQLNQEKLVFFTNVSHEFRTPLTLLMSHVDILLQKHTFGPVIYNQIIKIRKNAEQMHYLISELLEFRKLTQNHMKLQVVQQDISSFLKEAFLPFVDYAAERNINYENHFIMEPVSCPFDGKLMGRVIYNLLSNAFKYTPDGGEIVLSGKVTVDEVEFSVKDTGVGLTEKDVSQIFMRFYQGENKQVNEEKSPGTGIGLALSKAIVEKHHGDISVHSKVGEGSIFTVKLKRSIDEFKDDDQVDVVDSVTEPSYIIDTIPEVEHAAVNETDVLIQADSMLELPNDENAEKKYTVLLVEDNLELLQILVDLFSPIFQVVTATNGEEGLKVVYEQKVDLVISDIMMPKMSGTEMCLKIKNNIDFCHIPIILLTALDSTEKNIEGLSRGADDYVTKPFHAGLLLARANNLIRSRLLMQHQFDKRPMSEIDLTSINPLDQELLKKVTNIIEAHIDDPLFDIPFLCQELGVSRSLIYAKFKALTGMTPNNFILNYRLKFAATLLKQYKTMPISEVSDRTGFNSPVYFSQCFKKQFGMTPHAYKKETEVN